MHPSSHLLLPLAAFLATALVPHQAGAEQSQPSSQQPAPPERGKAAPTRAEALKKLYDDLAAAPDAAGAEAKVVEIERLWVQAESPTAGLLLERAVRAMEAKRPDLAQKFLDSVTDLYPEWAEGFNRRAYVYVIQQDYGRALGDLRRVLALDPRNFRALEGLMQVLHIMGRRKAALDVARELKTVHPFSPGLDEAIRNLEKEGEGQGI